jgi:hypothetical protein
MEAGKGGEEPWRTNFAEGSEYSDSENGEVDVNNYRGIGSHGLFQSYHSNDPFINNFNAEQITPAEPQPSFTFEVQQPTPTVATPDSPPPSEPSSSTIAPLNFQSFSTTDVKKPPSYTAHRPPPVNTSLRPPQPPKGASGTFYSPASTITTELSSPTRSIKSPVRNSLGNGNWRPSHSRQGSDTVAYTKEMDQETGEVRWLMERKRTGQDGIESVVGRAVVENGTI